MRPPPAPPPTTPPSRCPGVLARKPRRLRLLGIGISVVSAAAVFAWAVNQPAPHLPSSRGAWTWLVVAVGLYLVNACGLRGERWLLLLRRNGAERAQRSDC